LIIITAFILQWYLAVFMQSFFLHRYSAHKMFTMSTFWEKFFYILTFLLLGPSYLSPRAYGLMHRLHHAFADTKKDPHSPKYSANVFSMMWQTRKLYFSILNNESVIDKKFHKIEVYWPRFENMLDNWLVRISWIFIYFAFYITFAQSVWEFLLFPVHCLLGPIQGAIINWYCHRYGYVNYHVNDTSKNLFPLDFFMMGEGYHNNHHRFGGRANFGIKWHEWDFSYPLISLFNIIGIIKLKKNNDEKYM